MFCQTACIRPRADPEDESDWSTGTAEASTAGPVQVRFRMSYRPLCDVVLTIIVRWGGGEERGGVRGIGEERVGGGGGCGVVDDDGGEDGSGVCGGGGGGFGNGSRVVPNPGANTTVGLFPRAAARTNASTISGLALLRKTIVNGTSGTHKKLHRVVSYFTYRVWSYLLLRGTIVNRTKQCE